MSEQPTANNHKHDHAMQVDADGAVMNQNHETLPRNCNSISQDYAFTVHAGQAYAGDEPGMTFGFSQHEIQVKPCSRIKLSYVNDDQVRHQWMVHGLPRYLYPAGMFHIEAEGGQTKTGTFIVPGEERNYLIHCDMSQHMEKGMRGQLVVGKGSGDLWDVSGVSDRLKRDVYFTMGLVWLLATIAGLVGAAIVTSILATER